MVAFLVVARRGRPSRPKARGDSDGSPASLTQVGTGGEGRSHGSLQDIEISSFSESATSLDSHQAL
jgi:hypothetical protein